ncbi:TonB-dependent receptor [Edaphobacter flagellatus]|uniref:TonB-dependent receptor n=1 Tax=Edaphobacter flagellatus TaxID=1933044 RepID=UPI0021B1C0C5|nr:carboxypeptidase-like regulatory domain-containing protein [Edaphobacter flagellatus]
MQRIRAWKYSLILLFELTIVNACVLLAQSGTSSALTGEIVDSSGAAISSAIITLIDTNTRATRISESDATGHFLFSQINPATYEVTVEASGFAVSKSKPTSVGVGRTVALNFVLQIQSSNQAVDVTAQQGLLSLDNPNTTTTIEAKTIKSLPNPGQDLTYLAQFAQGALMNTAGSSNDAKAPGGYGNVEFNGLPATSNGYILDGYDTNDPWLGLNIGLSTNLVIGLDAVQEATVNTNSFAVDQGRYAVAQVNYFTKSGTNAFHGDMYEIWNGSLFNAKNYFLHANDTPDSIARKPRSTVNEFGASVSGPIRADKLFFFGHYEGIRIALPIVSQITLPTPAYQEYVLKQLAIGGTDSVTGRTLPAQPDEIPFYQKMFSLLPEPGGSPVPIIGCPLGTNSDGCASQRQASLNNSDTENLVVVKIDHTINAKDSVWYRFQQDTGLQAAYTDPINAIFNAYSPQPQRTLVAGYTHLFSSSVVNQFNPGASWYSSIFEPNNYSQVQQAFPIVLTSGSSSVPFTTIGGNNNTYPQGRKVTQWQINDNLTWTHKQHTWKFGINTRRLDVSNYDLGQGTVPTVTYNNLAQFTYGAAYTASKSFPVALSERVSAGNLEYYAMDTYKPLPKATLIYGMRVTWNTNITSAKNLFSRMAGSFLDASHQTIQPLNQVVIGNVRNLFSETPLFIYQPRVSFAYQFLPHTAVHGGFGVFNDIIPMQIADLAAMNAPNDPTFVGGIGGQVGGLAIAPGVPGSAIDATVSANNLFQTAFRSGGQPCVGIQPGDPTCPLAVSLNTFPSGKLQMPYYYQYNLGIEQQIGTRGNLRMDFVGTRGLHEPFQVQLNGYQTVCDGCFAPFPYQRPLDQRFGNVTEFRTDAGSNYAGLQMAYTQQLGGLTLRGNYTVSHCLDEISNGGLLAFSTQGLMSPLPGELRRQYASCDYDVRHNVSAFGLYQIPFHSRHPVLRHIFGGWSFSETAFFHSGLPFSVLSQPYIANGNGVFQASGASTVQFAAPAYANRVSGVPIYSQTPVAGVTIAGTKQWLNPNAFISVIDPATGACTGGDSLTNCQFGNSGRNSVRGPRYVNSDIYITKSFPIREQVALRLDAQMFNAFNHPNFALPSEVEAGVPGGAIPARFGTLQNTISPPTGLLGVGLGGDSSPRMIAFQCRIEF